MTPGKVERFHIELFDIAHSFAPGHRIRLEISSSAAPSYSPNQNTGNPVATDTEWKVAHQTIYHDRTRASSITLPVMTRVPEPPPGPPGSGARGLDRPGPSAGSSQEAFAAGRSRPLRGLL